MQWNFLTARSVSVNLGGHVPSQLRHLDAPPRPPALAGNHKEDEEQLSVRTSYVPPDRVNLCGSCGGKSGASTDIPASPRESLRLLQQP